MFGSIFARVSAVTLVLFILAFAAVAQDLDDVSVSGKVTDTNGLAVVGASVTASSTEMGIDRTVITGEDGRYQIVKLKPGTYKIKVAAAGFGVQETPEIPTISAQNVQKDFALAPAGVTAEQTVTVTEDDGPVIDTTRMIVGGTVTEREVEEIPNVGRNALDLVLTLGGTAEEQLSTNDLAEDRGQNPSGAPLEQGNFSISGGTAYSNNITIDGLDNNDDRSSRDRFQPSLEAIAEVQVIANQFSAEYGRASGGRVNIRTRSGGNKLRGRAFAFFRDESLNANSWYNNSRAIARPPMQQWNPGFTLSGPVVLPKIYDGHQKTFFAVAYEYDDFADTTLIDAYVPIGSNSRYTLPDPTGSILYCDNASAAACTSTPPTAGFIGGYNKIYDTPNVGHILTARIDHELFKNNNLTVGYQFGRRENRRTNGTAATRLENAFQAKNINTDAINFTDNHVFGAKVINQARFQWSVYEPSYQTDTPFDPVVLVGYRDPITNSVRTLIAGNSTTSTSLNFSDTRKETRWQFQDTVTYLSGIHSFKMGFDAQNVNSAVIGLGDATGTFNFGSVLSYEQNVINRYRQNFGTGQAVKNRYYGVFFNDQIRVSSAVTANLGLRYEKETAVDDNNNLGPRIGIAWSPFKTGRTVVRFGTGIFYNRVLLRTVGDSIQNSGGNLVAFDSTTIGTVATDRRRTAILAAIAGGFPSSYSSVEDLQGVVAAACLTVVNPEGPCNMNTGFRIGNVSSAGNPLRTVQDNLKIPESYQFNIGFEREVIKGWVFEANYTWNKTVHLWRDTNSNVPTLPAGYADWTDYLVHNPYTLSPGRMYTFFLGDPNVADPTGLHAGSETGGACGTTTPNCFVNLRTSSTVSTIPAVAVPGQNTNATGGPIGIALAAIAPFRPDQTVEETSLIGSMGNAFYHGLILELRSRFRRLGHGFSSSYRIAYTLSQTKDDGLNNTANAEINGDFAREWARNLQDRRHRFAISGTFDTPWWFGKLRLSPRFRYGSAAPFNLGDGGSDRNLDDLSTDRLNYSGNLKDIKWRNPGDPDPAELISKFSLQPIGAKGGNLPRNSGTGPAFYTLDLNVSREFRFSDTMKLRPVVEFGNILNAAVFSYGAAFIDFNNLTVTNSLARSNFLVPTRTYRQRQIRLGIRFDF